MNLGKMEKTGGYLVPVELRFINEFIGHGVFSLNFIPKSQPVWLPTLVEKWTCDELTRKLEEMSPEKANEYLRQGFILATDLDHFCANVTDLGRSTNHSSNPNSGYAAFTSTTDPSIALRDIQVGEEITVDYSGLGSPAWYKALCSRYAVLPTDEVAKLDPAV